MRPLANADVICAVLAFIDQNRGAFTTKERQIEALGDFIKQEDIQVVVGGYDPHRPSATALYGTLKAAVAPWRRRLSTYANLSNDEMVMTLFTIGRAALDHGFLADLDKSTLQIAGSTSTGPNKESEDYASVRNDDVKSLASAAFGNVDSDASGLTTKVKRVEVAGVSIKERVPEGNTELSSSRAADNETGTEVTELANEGVDAEINSQTSRSMVHVPDSGVDDNDDDDEDDEDNDNNGDEEEEEGANDIDEDQDDDDGDSDSGPSDTDDSSSQSDVDDGEPANIRSVKLEQSLRLLHRAIVRTASIIFPDFATDHPAQLDMLPSSELRDLYSAVLANKATRWKSAAVELLSQNILPARDFLQSLIWAFVRTYILDEKSSFTDLSRLLNVDQAPGRYLNDVLSTQSDLDVNQIRQQILIAQYDDNQFTDDILRPKVEIMVYDLMLILAGHIDQLDKTTLTHDWHSKFASGLFTVCNDASLLRGRFDMDSKVWKVVVWKRGKKAGGPGIKIDRRFPGRNVAFTVIPGLRTEERDASAPAFASAAVVVMRKNDAQR